MSSPKRGHSKWCRRRFQTRGRLSHLAVIVDASDDDARFTMKPPDQSLSECLRACQKCHSVCVQMAGNSLLRGDAATFSSRVCLLLETADICGMTAEGLLRKSPCFARICAICAELCQVSAKAFEDAEELNECAATCFQCAALCGQMSRLAHHDGTDSSCPLNGSYQL